MKTNVLLAVVTATVAGFLLGWLIFGVALDSFYKANTTFYQGLMKDPPSFLSIFIYNLFWGILIVLIFDKWAGIRSFGQGFIWGAVIDLLVIAGIDILFAGLMNLYTVQIVVVDIIANTILGGLIGGAAGLVLGMGKAKTVTA
jgi:hypothetical protein